MVGFRCSKKLEFWGLGLLFKKKLLNNEPAFFWRLAALHIRVYHQGSLWDSVVG